MSNSDATEKSTGDGVVTIADAYLQALEHQVDQNKLDEIAEKIEDGEDRREKLIEEHGEDSFLVEKASNAIAKLREERDELNQTSKTIAERRQALLNAIVEDPGFALNEEWLQPKVTEMVTHALYGDRDTSFFVHNREISQPENVAAMDEFDRIEIEHIIVSLARDRLSGTETVQSRWIRLSDSVTFPALEELYKHGAMSPKAVASNLGEDSTTIKDRLKNFFQWDEFVPVYRPEDGAYTLSTTGRYLLTNYSEVSRSGDIDHLADSTMDEEAPDDEPDDGDSDSGQKQSTLMDSQSEDDAAKKSKEPTSERESEPKDTEEKASQMFADVSDSE